MEKQKSTSDIFPKWVNAWITLDCFCKRVRWCHVSFSSEIGSISIGFLIPESYIDSMPPEEKGKVFQIIADTQKEFIPSDIKDNFKNEFISQKSLERIKSFVLRYEKEVEHKTGRNAIDTLRHNFGLDVIKNIKFELTLDLSKL
jgi:hypothetical protein